MPLHATFYALPFVLFFSALVGLVLGFGFIPSSESLLGPLLRRLTHSEEVAKFAALPLLAAFFVWTAPKSASKPSSGWGPLLFFQVSWLPWLIALVFGGVLKIGGFSQGGATLQDFLWTGLLVPFSEECLFRGWYMKIAERLWGSEMATTTNPLPIPVWGSAIAFSVWHLQNLGALPLSFIAFQVFYTFCAGLWLGFIQWKYQNLTYPVLAHSVLNVASLIPQV